MSWFVVIFLPVYFLPLHVNCVGVSCFTYKRSEKPLGGSQEVRLDHLLLFCGFVFLARKADSELRSLLGKSAAGSRTYIPCFCFSGASLLLRTGWEQPCLRGLRRGTGVVPPGGRGPNAQLGQVSITTRLPGSPESPAVPADAQARELPARGGFSRRASSGESWAQTRGRGQASRGRRGSSGLFGAPVP